MGELTPNPKYQFKSDRERVPRGKAEKYSHKRLKDLKSNSHKIVTALRGCSVRFEKRAGEFSFVARLTKGSRSESEYENAIVTEGRPEAR